MYKHIVRIQNTLFSFQLYSCIFSIATEPERPNYSEGKFVTGVDYAFNQIAFDPVTPGNSHKNTRQILHFQIVNLSTKQTNAYINLKY